MVNIQTVMTWIFPALYFEWSKKLVWAGDYDHYKSAHHSTIYILESSTI